MRNVLARYAFGIVCTLALALVPQVVTAETVLITGANSGIGLEFTKQYAAKGWTVIATHRRAETPKTLADLAARFDKLRIERLDVTDLEQVNALAARLSDVPIDVLINNAALTLDLSSCAMEDVTCPGDWSTQNFGKLSYPLFDAMLAVNVKGPLMVSEAFLGHVKASSQKKIVAISSALSSLTGPMAQWPGAMFYRTSKAGLNKSMQIVASSVKAAGVTVLVLDPGPTLTERNSHIKNAAGWLETPVTVEHMVKTIEQATIKETGHFLRYDGAREAW